MTLDPITDDKNMAAPRDHQPLRLHPGDDVRSVLVKVVSDRGDAPAFLVSGIGSLTEARLRFAGQSDDAIIPGPLEIISISGSVTSSGAHLHMSVSDGQGRVLGGHVGFGNIVRTTVEALLVFLPGWNLSRAPDPVTGFDELVIVSPHAPGLSG